MKSRTDRQLLSKFFGQPDSHSQRRLVVQLPATHRKAPRGTKLFVRRSLHADEETAAVPVSTLPFLNVFMD